MSLSDMPGGDAGSPLCKLRPLSGRVGTRTARAAWRAGLEVLTPSSPHCNSGLALARKGVSLYTLGECFPLESQGFFPLACPSFPKPTSLTSPPACDLTRQTMEAFIYSEKSRQFPPWCLAREAI